VVTIGKHKEQRAEKNMEEFEAAVKRADEAQIQVDTLEVDNAVLDNQLKEVEGQLKRLSICRDREKGLIESMFRGRNGIGDNKEDDLEDAERDCEEKLEVARKDIDRQNDARDKLHQAHELLQTANRELGHAFRLANFDVANDFILPGPGIQGPMGIAGDIRKRRAVEMAKQATAQAGALITEAIRIVPDVPRVDAAKIHNNLSVWGDIVFDNLVSDIRARRKIKESLENTIQMEQDCAFALRWMEVGIEKQYQPVFDRAFEQHSIAKASLDSYRRELIRQALNGNESSSKASQFQNPEPAPLFQLDERSPKIVQQEEPPLMDFAAAPLQEPEAPPSYDSLFTR
jgi:hypothetical protein